MNDGHSSESDLDQIDRRILDLLNRRAEAIRDVSGQDPFASEDVILKSLISHNQGPLSEGQVVSVFREILSQGRILAAPASVSYLGPPASFTHQAAHRRFGTNAELVPSESISSVFKDVESGRSRFGVVPVENSTEGAVTYTLDLLVNSTVQICAEVNLRIHHCLLSNGPIEDIDLVYSHPQVFGQCREWIKERIPRAELKEVKSTADAAQRSLRDNKAAIASRMASKLYGIPILQEAIEDNPNNSTRFLVLSNTSPPPTGDDKTSICFAFKDRPGALYDVLHSFKREDINLTMIQSRPSKVRNWDYVFFMDMEGHADDPHVSAALSALEEECVFLRILGSYPMNDSIQ